MNRLVSRSLVTVLLLGVLLCLPGIASADGVPGVVAWTLTGVTFSDGGTASGSFDYNSTTNSYTNIDITTAAGTGFGGATYTSISSAFPGSSAVSLFLGASSGNLSGTPLLALFFDIPLVNSGGTVTAPLTTGFDFGGGEGTCDNADCSSSTEDRFITGGAVTSSVVTTPEPSVLLLFGVGLAGLLGLVAIRKVS